MELPAHIRDGMIEHAREEDPNECCGILAAADGKIVKQYRIANAEKSPYRYQLDGREYVAALREIDDNGWELAVIYHSHTHSPAYPSATDIRLVTWPDAYYLLVSLEDKANPVVRVFRIVEGEVTEEPIEAA